tara:strand:+ start:2088 stop:2348 length:261 start_codon:yes stop_codon:yes gene_type:complete
MADNYVSSAEITPPVVSLNKAAASFEAATGGDQHVARRKLQLEAQKLLYSLEEPNHEVWPRIFQVGGVYKFFFFHSCCQLKSNNDT